MIDLHEGVLEEFAERAGRGLVDDDRTLLVTHGRARIYEASLARRNSKVSVEDATAYTRAEVERLPQSLVALEQALLRKNAALRAAQRDAVKPKAPRKRSAEYLAKHAERNRTKWRAKHWGGQTKPTQTESKAA